MLACASIAALAGCGSGSGNSASVGSTTTTTTTGAASTQSTASSSTTTSATSSSAAGTSSSTTTSTSSSSSATAKKPVVGMLALTSPAFARGGKIPVRYTCDGANESPPLAWSHVPAGTAQLFLFVLDLAGGAKNAIRWSVGDISPSVTKLAAGSVPAGAVVGRNSSGKAAWGGICASDGKPHSIVFLLYALRKKLGLAGGFDPKTVQKQLGGNTVGAGVMFGSYKHA